LYKYILKKCRRINETQSPATFVYDSNIPEIRDFAEDFRALHLPPNIIMDLHGVFEEIDEDGSGEIDLREVLDYMDLERNPFARRIFSIMDEDKSGQINFREFVISMWSYCTLGKAALIIFAFDIFDRDSSGEIDIDEVKCFLKEVYGGDITHNALAQQTLEAIGGYLQPSKKWNYKGARPQVITKEAFGRIARACPALLFPAFQLQTKLQTRILGEKFWERLTSSRVEISRGTYMSVAAVLQSRIDSAAGQLVETKAGETLDPEEEHLEEAKEALHKGRLVNSVGIVSDRRATNGTHVAVKTPGQRMRERVQKRLAIKKAEQREAERQKMKPSQSSARKRGSQAKAIQVRPKNGKGSSVHPEKGNKGQGQLGRAVQHEKRR